MDKLLVDSDVILDMMAERKPFYDHAARLFTLADSGELQVFISALTIPNLHYILSSHLSSDEAAKRLLQFKTLVTVLPLTEKIIDLGLSSNFRDVENAFQYFTALEHNIPTLITRNLKDYKTATIAVLNAEQFLKGRPV